MKQFAALLCAGLTALFLYVFPDQARTLEARTLEASTTRLVKTRASGPLGGRDAPYAGPGVRNATLTGTALVIDGDTIEIQGRRIRLEGIDAPEIRQQCTGRDGVAWPAGKVAATALERWLRGRVVSCEPVGRDGYGRTLGRCLVNGHDINAGMIRAGLAWAFVKYSTEFVAEEAAARRAANGIWAVSCQPAWDYRANRWQEGAQSAPGGCAIKGNITSRGRIYHMPWSPWYGRTRVETAKGERWFCDERQAQAAGWRPAQVR